MKNSRLTSLVLPILLACGPRTSQEIAPTKSTASVEFHDSTKTVTYSKTSDSEVIHCAFSNEGNLIGYYGRFDRFGYAANRSSPRWKEDFPQVSKECDKLVSYIDSVSSARNVDFERNGNKIILR